jgi:hypothetical protein
LNFKKNLIFSFLLMFVFSNYNLALRHNSQKNKK